MDRPRYRRRDPERTGPIRNAGGAWREGEPRRDAARPGGDAASRGVREGYRVIDEQIRRGRRVAQELDEEEESAGPSRGRRSRSEHEERFGREEGDRSRGTGGFRFLAGQMRRTERLVREVLRQIGSARPDPWKLAELVFLLYVESVSDLARAGFDAVGVLAPRRADFRREDPFEEDVDRIERDVDERLEEIEEEEPWEEPWDWPAVASTPTVIRTTVPIPIYVWSETSTEIDLDLLPGAQSLGLQVEPLRSGEALQPPLLDVDLVAVANGPMVLRIVVPSEQVAGRYRGQVLNRATGEPVGMLTVTLGFVATEDVP